MPFKYIFLSCTKIKRMQVIKFEEVLFFPIKNQNLDGYYISMGGEIYSSKSGRILSQEITYNGYKRIKIKGEKEYVHRLVAATFLGLESTGKKVHVDHINEIKTDNRVENLRVVSARQNISRNKGKHSKLAGVCRYPNGTYCAHIRIDGKLKYLGSFNNEQDAHEAYLEERNRIGDPYLK